MLGDLGHGQPDSPRKAPAQTSNPAAAPAGGPRLAARTPASVKPLAARWASVYRSSAGQPSAGRLRHQYGIRRPSRPGAPHIGGASGGGRTGRNPHLWTALWMNPGTKGRQPGE
jgi:hypothetical protein